MVVFMRNASKKVPQPLYLKARHKRCSFWCLNFKLYAVGLSYNLWKCWQLV